MKVLITLTLTLSFATNICGQERLLKHYQSKLKIESLPELCSVFNPEDYSIVFPDSTFDEAEVVIRKMKLKKTGNFLMSLTTKGKKIDQIVLRTKRKTAAIKLYQIMCSSNSSSLESAIATGNANTWKLANVGVKKMGRIYEFKLDCSN